MSRDVKRPGARRRRKAQRPIAVHCAVTTAANDNTAAKISAARAVAQLTLAARSAALQLITMGPCGTPVHTLGLQLSAAVDHVEAQHA